MPLILSLMFSIKQTNVKNKIIDEACFSSKMAVFVFLWLSSTMAESWLCLLITYECSLCSCPEWKWCCNWNYSCYKCFVSRTCLLRVSGPDAPSMLIFQYWIFRTVNMLTTADISKIRISLTSHHVRRLRKTYSKHFRPVVLLVTHASPGTEWAFTGNLVAARARNCCCSNFLVKTLLFEICKVPVSMKDAGSLLETVNVFKTPTLTITGNVISV